MSPPRQSHSSSSSSDTNSISSNPSRSSSIEPARYANTKPRHPHHHHSAYPPPAFPSRKQSNDLQSNPYPPSSSSSDQTSPNPSPAPQPSTPRTTKPKKKTQNAPSSRNHPNLKGQRSCLDLDWSYRNLYAAGSTHGRKSIAGGGGPVGACVLM